MAPCAPYQESLLIAFSTRVCRAKSVSVCVCMRVCVCIGVCVFLSVSVCVFNVNKTHNCRRKTCFSRSTCGSTHLSRNGVADVESELET